MTAPSVEPQGSPGAAPLALNLDQAQQFLELLDPDAEDFVFQTFDDSPLKSPALGKIFYGSIDAMCEYLARMQQHGAGVFVTINKTQGSSRKAKDVERVRANFADLDGAPLQPVLACPLEPHMIVESSPGKYHAYWITEGMALEQFTPVQKAIAARFNGDRSVNDLPRVMRLPGFLHQKAEPFRTVITHLSDRMPYKAEKILAEFPPVAQANGHDHTAADDVQSMAELIRLVMTAENYHAPLRNLAWRYLVSGMDQADARRTLHGLMEAVPEPHDERWHARVNDIDRAVETAYRKISHGNLTDLTEDGLAINMAKSWEPDSRYVAMMNRWFFWEGGLWRVDETKQHLNRAAEWMRIQAETVVSTHPSLRKAAKALREKSTIMAVEALASCHRGIAARADLWDQDQMLLGGEQTIDLRTGATYEPRHTDYITKSVAVAPSREPPTLWLQCLETWTNGDKELQAYLQRMCGYCLAGSIEEEVFFFFYGLGRNGKTRFAETIKGILGDYAGTMGSEVLMQSQTERHPTEIARLRGLRLAVASEVEKGRAWAENKIKSLTGGDTLQARFMRCDIFEFKPTFKLLVVGNNKPTLRAVDEAIRRRMHLIPFTVQISEEQRDPKLAEKLRAEWRQILGWMIEGCMEWQRIGLNPPKAVLAATAEYLAGEDSFEQWREACTTTDPKAWETSAALFASWKTWAEAANEHVGSQKMINQQLVNHGCVWAKQFGARGYFGLKLRNPAEEAHEFLKKQGFA